MSDLNDLIIINKILDKEEYKSYKIPQKVLDNKEPKTPPLKSETDPVLSFSNEQFCEIEFDPNPVNDTEKVIPKPQKIMDPEKDEIRKLFIKMRDISREQRSFYKFPPPSFADIQRNNAKIFYEQGMFMKDFEDSYDKRVPFFNSQPTYQTMGYEQLRTYFTWRTEVRKENVTSIAIPYASVYIFELINNIGERNPEDALDKLVSFWKKFRLVHDKIDSYIINWFKDYHIYYELTDTFKKFIDENDLSSYFPEITEPVKNFDLFCYISKYDIRQSKFYFDNKKEMIIDCFYFVLDKIREEFDVIGIPFDEALFRPRNKIVRWDPFKNTTFHHRINQPDRSVLLSQNEIYICSDNRWTTCSKITTEEGRRFISYVFKQMESTLRKLTKYKHKISADIGMIAEKTLLRLNKSNLSIEKVVNNSVIEFYKDLNKTTVTVNPLSLDRIRQEMLVVQEALTVEETKTTNINDFFSEPDSEEPVQILEESETISDVWEQLKIALNDNELNALRIILENKDIIAFANQCGEMAEVLMDGINEKAMDCIGDNLTDEEFVIYEDYIEPVKGMLK